MQRTTPSGWRPFHPRYRALYRPQLETLEERLPPGDALGGLIALSLLGGLPPLLPRDPIASDIAILDNLLDTPAQRRSNASTSLTALPSRANDLIVSASTSDVSSQDLLTILARWTAPGGEGAVSVRSPEGAATSGDIAVQSTIPWLAATLAPAALPAPAPFRFGPAASPDVIIDAQPGTGPASVGRSFDGSSDSAAGALAQGGSNDILIQLGGNGVNVVSSMNGNDGLPGLGGSGGAPGAGATNGTRFGLTAAASTDLFVGTTDKKAILFLDVNTPDSKRFRFITSDTPVGAYDTGKELVEAKQWQVVGDNPKRVVFQNVQDGVSIAGDVLLDPSNRGVVDVAKAGKRVRFLVTPISNAVKLTDTFDQSLPNPIETFQRTPFLSPNDQPLKSKDQNGIVTDCKLPNPGPDYPAPTPAADSSTPCVNEIGFKVDINRKDERLPTNLPADIKVQSYKWAVTGDRGPLKRVLNNKGTVDSGISDPTDADAKPFEWSDKAKGLEFESWKPTPGAGTVQKNQVSVETKLAVGTVAGKDRVAQQVQSAAVQVNVLSYLTDGMWIDNNGDNKFENDAKHILLRSNRSAADMAGQIGTSMPETFLGSTHMSYKPTCPVCGYQPGDPVWFDSKDDNEYDPSIPAGRTSPQDFTVVGNLNKGDKGMPLANVVAGRMDEHYLWHVYFGGTAEGPIAPADKRGFELLRFHRRFTVTDFDAYRAANGLPAIANVTKEADIPLMWPYPLRTGGGPTASRQYRAVPQFMPDAKGYTSANALGISSEMQDWHGGLHTFSCGRGDQQIFTSPRDISFFWYHRLIDDLWQTYQAKGLPDYG